jgi:hypothetical protein
LSDATLLAISQSGHSPDLFAIVEAAHKFGAYVIAIVNDDTSPLAGMADSHDRDFLDRTITAVLFTEGDGRFTEYAGGYSDMAAQRDADFEPEPVLVMVRDPSLDRLRVARLGASQDKS